MSRDARQRLVDAIEAAREAVVLVGKLDVAGFVASRVVFLAVERCVFVVGEALAQVPDTVQEAHPEIAWREIIGMRNILAHGYFRIDPGVLWTTVTRDLPPLAADLARLATALGRRE
jgi:uncharacterized protein with HEPN domain